jgi:hypothetical protein
MLCLSRRFTLLARVFICSNLCLHVAEDAVLDLDLTRLVTLPLVGDLVLNLLLRELLCRLL